MFINKSLLGKNNVCGLNIRKLRKEQKWSQNDLAIKLQLLGLNIEKNAIQRIESGQRFVTDIEILYLVTVFHITLDELLDFKIQPSDPQQ